MPVLCIVSVYVVTHGIRLSGYSTLSGLLTLLNSITRHDMMIVGEWLIARKYINAEIMRKSKSKTVTGWDAAVLGINFTFRVPLLYCCSLLHSFQFTRRFNDFIIVIIDLTI